MHEDLRQVRYADLRSQQVTDEGGPHPEGERMRLQVRFVQRTDIRPGLISVIPRRSWLAFLSMRMRGDTPQLQRFGLPERLLGLRDELCDEQE